MSIDTFEKDMDIAIASGDPEAIKALLKSSMENLDTMLTPAPEMPELLNKPIAKDYFN